MKVTRSPYTISVSQLKCGECFSYENSDVYIVAEPSNYINDRFKGFVLAVVLSSGQMTHWQGSSQVTQVDMEAIEK